MEGRQAGPLLETVSFTLNRDPSYADNDDDDYSAPSAAWCFFCCRRCTWISTAVLGYTRRPLDDGLLPDTTDRQTSTEVLCNATFLISGILDPKRINRDILTWLSTRDGMLGILNWIGIGTRFGIVDWRLGLDGACLLCAERGNSAVEEEWKEVSVNTFFLSQLLPCLLLQFVPLILYLLSNTGGRPACLNKRSGMQVSQFKAQPGRGDNIYTQDCEKL